MSDTPELPDPPRLPLRLRVPAGAADIGGAAALEHWRDVWPGDPDYDAAYRRAVYAHRVTGASMPYSDAEDRAH